MLKNVFTEGIILSRIKYGESSLIVKAYTKHLGLITFIAKGYNSSKKDKNKNIFQPLNQVELELFQHKPNSLYSLKSINQAEPNNMLFDMAKTAVAFFWSELILRYIQEEEQNNELFVFMKQKCKLLAVSNQEQTNELVIKFLFELTEILGLLPSLDYHIGQVFCMKEGCFVDKPMARIPVANTQNELLINFLEKSTSYTKPQRKQLITFFIDYIDIQLSRTGKIKSLEVFEQI